jgi:anthraniloyl-CoA monooxygenase
VAPEKAQPPMLTPFRLRDVVLPNRIVLSPMVQYVATDGMLSDDFFAHLSARAIGGAGLVLTDMVAVSAAGRKNPACPGLYQPEHIAGWRRLTDFVHHNTSARIALQIGHADVAQIVSQVSLVDLQAILADFVSAAQAADAAGFDWLELHCAHDSLLSNFISPLTNHRIDEYGGSLSKCCLYPLQVFAAIRAVWPTQKPISVLISSCDWLDDGINPDVAVMVAKMFKQAGADMIHCSSGQVSQVGQERAMDGRMFQTPLSDRVRNEADIPGIAAGAIEGVDHANGIIAAGRADLCALNCDARLICCL